MIEISSRKRWHGWRRRRARPILGAVIPARGLLLPLAIALLCLLLLVACNSGTALEAGSESFQVSLTVDGTTHNLTTDATNVRELLEEAGVSTEPADEITPPPFTPLQDGMAVSVVRVSEQIEVIEESIPFARRIVRSEAMGGDEPPRIIQGGRAGLQEIRVRVIYRDGEEVERQRTQVTLVEEPLDEIVMVGVGANPGAVSFPGVIAYISGGNTVLLRSSTILPDQLETGGNLDGRVFSLSPTGSHLLYTRIMSNTDRFNNALWVVRTERGAEPQRLDVDNVLWADWNPSLTSSQEIAFTTGNPVHQPPGWEANNDLWVATLRGSDDSLTNVRQVVDAYPATYGWWGGHYAWSPGGRSVAYSYADEVGIINLESGTGERRTQLHTFTEYNTRANWVWVPSLTWSPEGGYLAFTAHGGDDPEAMVFDTWVANVTNGVVGKFVEQAGMWSHPSWSPFIDPTNRRESQIAYLKASTPLDSLRSNYTLWLMDADGSNARQIYPRAGENSRFPRERQFMAWGPSGRDMAFIFNDDLYLFDVGANSAYRVTEDDIAVSRPTWAPYGAGITSEEVGDESVAPIESDTQEGDPLRDRIPLE